METNTLFILEDIKTQIIQNSCSDKNISLLSGSTGQLLFLVYYHLYIENIDHEIDRFLTTYIYELTNKVHGFSYCNGISGVLLGLEMINKLGEITFDTSSIKNNYKEICIKLGKLQIQEGHCDVLHCGLGILKPFWDIEDVRRTILISLSNLVENDSAIKWLSDGMKGSNYSLSHGWAGFLAYICQLYKVYPSNSTADLIKQVSYNLIDWSYLGEKYIDHSFKMFQKDEIIGSRLAWCYGDLGISVSLYNAGLCIEDHYLIELSSYVLCKHATNILNEYSNLNDACLCHGTSGVAMIYLYMFKKTGNKLFGDAATYWIDKTISYYKQGYKFFQNNQYEDDYTMLNGLCGVGLALISFYNYQRNIHDTDWSSLILI